LILFILIYVPHSLMILPLQNTSLPFIANGLLTHWAYSILITEFLYHHLVTSTCKSSSIIITTSLLVILDKTKHWNSFTTDICGQISSPIFRSSTSPVLSVCNPNHSTTSSIDSSSSFPFINDYRILFLLENSVKEYSYIKKL